MANDVTGNPWVIDTASANLVWTGNAKISHIEFAGYAADADNATITDAANRVVAILNGNVALETERTGKIGWVYNGVKVPTLSAGKVYIFLDTR